MSPGPAWVFGLGGIMGIVLMTGVFLLDAYGNWLAARKDKHKNAK